MTASIERGAVAALVALAVGLGARGANAAPLASNASPEPTDAQLASARALYREAELLRRQEKLDEALSRIEAAYRLVKTPVIALELAKIRQQLGLTAAAYSVLRAAEAMPPSGRETEKGREARREASALAASLRDRVGTLRVTLPGAAPDLELRVDGDAVSSADEIAVDPGTHAVALLLEGRACATVSVAVKEGDARTVDLRERAGACVPEAAPRDVEPPARDREAVVPPPPRDEAALPVKRPDELLSTSRYVTLGLMGAGAVSIAAGGYFAVRAKSQYDSVTPDCPDGVCTPYAYDVRQAARAHATGSTFAILLGLGAVAGGVTLWIVDPSRDHPAAPRVGRVGLGVAPSSLWMTVTMP